MQVNELGFVASILFVLVPAVFLLILYIQTASSQGKKE
ncbi:MAG: photosystem II reaction center protein PsbM [Oscillatoria sp. PMC 1051.18]|nr:photosystem II reaction center protein PsbM [Oscillatoria salina]MBZ8178600.1 photosystem II reaction center protein M [Oscillatoria salina IIICB1]MEC4895565.1 photosystem II reaction center protein PsbM [Oscillatoria sp. PMC 1050.18]MEC5032265.1 photosystem II reaction center protein PsbM [Oscillatoria sp. PMC 1051.18]NET90216.1 photosystem II reaction center protein M [Kamptonema sp. SIO1D9]